jgi:molybdopterin/thiamine biosynthesis adenylyltransferase
MALCGGKESMNNVTIPQIFFIGDAWEKMLDIAEKQKQLETGGMLLGKVCDNDSGRSLVVTQVTGPGPKGKHETCGFRPDIAYYRKTRQKYPQLDYLGEWHKHPHGCARYSERDLGQAMRIVQEEKVGEFVCPILSTVEAGHGITRLQAQCFYLHAGLASFLPLSYSIIPQLDDQAQPLRYLAVEEDLVRRFLASREACAVVSADIYARERVAHLYVEPFQGNGKVMLVNSRKCKEIALPYGVRLLVTVAQDAKSLRLRAFALEKEGSRSYEITPQLVSPRADIFTRNAALLETSLLCDRHVAIIGLGSVGSVAALELARAGVGNFTLIDPDTLQIHNLCRHACDLSELGMDKVTAVARRIQRIVPMAQVTAHAKDINSDPHQALLMLKHAHVILVATDTENSRRLANWAAQTNKIPVIFAGLLERASGGRVWRVVPGKTACYNCYPADERLSKGQVAYSEVQSPRDITVQPGLGNDIAFISHLAVRYVIETLKEPQAEKLSALAGNMVFWFNQTEPRWQCQALSLYHVTDIERHPQCEFCGK